MPVTVTTEDLPKGARATATIRRPSPREVDRAAMLDLLRPHAAELTAAMATFGSAADTSDTDEGAERLATLATAATLDALVHVARAQGWRP